MTIASPKGQITLDKVSLEGDAKTAETKKWLEDGTYILPYTLQKAVLRMLVTCPLAGFNYLFTQGDLLARDKPLVGRQNPLSQNLVGCCR